ncbi:universal stress protein [Hyphomicrobium sp. 99]|uniref:universal stress protein n=1 Tax=Hyphomicrobium sp. 99 TaxID=1163419 RepID=UPI0005F81065|nr:universal stress protein [Hyphomicrobium sp. 99]
MYKHLLIATDGSELAGKAVEQGFALAKAVNAKVTILTVTEPWGMDAPAEVAIVYPVEEYERAAAANARKILDDASAAGMKLQIACQTVHVKDQYPAEAIVETASTHGCDLIVMASHGHRGLMRLVLGSQAHRVVTQSTTSVLICR